MRSRNPDFDKATYLDFETGELKKIKVPYAMLYFDDLHKWYKDFFRIQYWKRQGMTQPQVADILQLEELEIRDNWNVHPSKVKPPTGFQKKVRRYELELLKLNFEPFKPVQVIRNFAPNTGLYNILRKAIDWEPAMLRKFNPVTKEVTWHDMSSHGRMVFSFDSLRTGIQPLDNILESVQASLEITDPAPRVHLNKYSSGRAKIGEHEHDFWSAILSFGASRVMFVEKQPVVLHDGDLLVFGTHRHGIPKQPIIREGRISVAIFYHPERVSLIERNEVKIWKPKENNVAERLVTPPEREIDPINKKSIAEWRSALRLKNSRMDVNEDLLSELDQPFNEINEANNLAISLGVEPFEESTLEPLLDISPCLELDLGDDPLSALYERACKKENEMALKNVMDEDEQLALALYMGDDLLSQSFENPMSSELNISRVAAVPDSLGEDEQLAMAIYLSQLETCV